MNDRLGIEYGAVTAYAGKLSFVPNSVDAYSVGGFVGLDYMLDKHAIIFGSIQPYAYRQNFDRTIQYQIFEQGTLGLAYVF
jgi:hypothetical protein